ncbi:T-cell surface antigen CD2-like [Pholidichthys leucotaenia]
MMGCFTATLGVLILFGFVNPSTANKDSCELYAAAGQSLTLPFVYQRLANSHVLRWTHNKTIVFLRQTGRVRVGNTRDINATGSLLLKNLVPSSAGTYEAVVLYPNETLAVKWSGSLCLMDKVSKPHLSYECDFKSSAVNLKCTIAKPQGLTFSWTLDGKPLPNEAKQALSVSLNQLKGVRSFTCSVANKVSNESSDKVVPACKSPPTPAPLCFTPKTVVAVLAGLSGLILFLLITVTVLCCLRRRKIGNERELRMLSLKQRQHSSVNQDYETMHPSPQPSPRGIYQTLSRPIAETEYRPAELPTKAEGQQPSPVPKPRTKNLQTINI